MPVQSQPMYLHLDPGNQRPSNYNHPSTYNQPSSRPSNLFEISWTHVHNVQHHISRNCTAAK